MQVLLFIVDSRAKPGLGRRRAWRQWYLTSQYAERLGHEIGHFLIWSLLESGCLSNLGTSHCRLPCEARPQQEERNLMIQQDATLWTGVFIQSR